MYEEREREREREREKKRRRIFTEGGLTTHTVTLEGQS